MGNTIDRIGDIKKQIFDPNRDENIGIRIFVGIREASCHTPQFYERVLAETDSVIRVDTG